LLNEKGYQAYMGCGGVNPEWNEKTVMQRGDLKQFRANGGIAVYGEQFIDRGNFYHAPTAVGWQLGRFGECQRYNANFDFYPSLSVTGYNDPQLFINVTELEMFNNEGTGDRPYTTVWIGKGSGEVIERLKFTHLIAYHRNGNFDFLPSGVTVVKARHEIADVLRKSRLLISYDSASAVITEARLCGCPVTWMPNTGNLPGFNLCSEKLWLEVNAEYGTLDGIARTNTPEEIKRAGQTVRFFGERYRHYIAREELQVDQFIRTTQALGEI
jgi:hypothetical protein